MISFVLLFGLLNATLGMLCYVYPSSYEWYGIYYFSLGIISLFLYLIYFKWSLLFQTRIALLSIIGYFAGFVKVIDPNLLFSPVEVRSQSLEIGARMFGLTSVALFGSFLGLTLGFRRINLNKRTLMARLYVEYNNWYLVYYASIAIVLITGYLSALSYGPTVFDGVYGIGLGKGQVLGNLQSIGVVCAILNIAASMIINRTRFLYFSIIAILYFFVWGILIRGGRLEVLSGLLTIAICIPLLNNVITNVTKRQILYVIVLAIFMESWGWLRSTLSTADSETIIDGYKRLAENGIYFAGTISAIATTFANTLHMIDSNIINHTWGLSYLEYIPRTPPEFMYPNRPADYSAIFEAYDYAAIGGFFELAEAYLNFGLLGCFFVPMILSFGLSKLYKKAFNGGLFWFLILSAVLSVFFRGAWYQSFAFYKSLFTGLIIYALFVLVVSLTGTHKSRRKSIDHLAPWSEK